VRRQITTLTRCLVLETIRNRNHIAYVTLVCILIAARVTG